MEWLQSVFADFQWRSWIGLVLAVGLSIGASLVFSWLVQGGIRFVANRDDWPAMLARRLTLPLRVTVFLVGGFVALAVTMPEREWRAAAEHGLKIALIASVAWLLGSLVMFVADLSTARYPRDMDNRHVRRLHTQLQVFQRVAIVIIAVVAVGAILLTFPDVQTIGASMLASAGLASIVAGLALQSVLANLFAGMQLAVTGAIHVDDIVVVENEWGRIKRITLSYVVVEVWDSRTLVLPCTYFTTQPFENWTKEGNELLGTVDFDLDWRVSTTRMRERLEQITAHSELWDGRTSILQVLDAVGGLVRIRCVISAADAAKLYDLRCLVREKLVLWVQAENAAALPVQRFEYVDPEAPAPLVLTEPIAVVDRAVDAAEGMFSGSPEAEERAAVFTQTLDVEAVERELAHEFGYVGVDRERELVASTGAIHKVAGRGGEGVDFGSADGGSGGEGGR
ncbi:mechanosensitive ion channel protein MscS [Agromyces rhizosphaerae]|uniref:Mechanosensitive ion channel protein MscS n=1 Tax=Agromyces rhizosphaerae TaxID=88374 RepID=A0A9W6CW19_9MICO|nr:mechanosensitive ion channel domain-containing protein [Agromyces rhizosphaerae]GLI27552.1 mechanosensitive ion channel protein MscS [Agromyces rhizosphaerae]